ncbi:MAG: hypothetical protein NC191_03605 [Muribaculaceae bacterium]|nr:hypothetical protein [Muribaculaceae bacterium]
MKCLLTNREKEIVIMLASGHNSSAILDWFGLEYNDFLKIKRQIFKQLKITRTIQLLSAAIKYGII